MSNRKNASSNGLVLKVSGSQIPKRSSRPSMDRWLPKEQRPKCLRKNNHNHHRSQPTLISRTAIHIISKLCIMTFATDKNAQSLTFATDNPQKHIWTGYNCNHLWVGNKLLPTEITEPESQVGTSPEMKAADGIKNVHRDKLSPGSNARIYKFPHTHMNW